MIQQTQQWSQKTRFVKKEGAGGSSLKNNLLKIERRESNRRNHGATATKSTPFQLYQQSSIKAEHQFQQHQQQQSSLATDQSHLHLAASRDHRMLITN